jgi:hypothetical protein
MSSKFGHTLFVTSGVQRSVTDTVFDEIKMGCHESHDTALLERQNVFYSLTVKNASLHYTAIMKVYLKI